MTKKALTRAEIAEMLRTRPGQSADELATLTLDALQAALEGIAAGSIPGGYTIDCGSVGARLSAGRLHGASCARSAADRHALRLARSIPTGHAR